MYHNVHRTSSWHSVEQKKSTAWLMRRNRALYRFRKQLHWNLKSTEMKLISGESRLRFVFSLLLVYPKKVKVKRFL